MNKFKHPASGMLAACLAQHETPGDNRLNSSLPKLDIGETIRLAVEMLEHERNKPTQSLEMTASEVNTLWVALAAAATQFTEKENLDNAESMLERIERMRENEE